MTPIYIFDLDGTLANIEHRVPLIRGDNKDWRAFFAACSDDAPIEPVIRLFRSLREYARCWVWSGRSDEVREQTLTWLQAHGVMHEPVRTWLRPEALKMRKAGDHRHDHVIKREWLDALDPRDRACVAGVFEDRDSVVAMWRDAGLQCYQVAPGNF
jgi:FMN phosphatase YigB (HAD superfamily)